MRRLWAFVRPYRGVFWAALLLSPVQPGLQPGAALSPEARHRPLRRVAATSPGSAGSRWSSLAAIVGEFGLFYGQQYLTMVVAQRSLADLRVRGVRATSSACRCATSIATPVGRLVSRVTTDVDVLNEMFAAGAMTIVLDGLKLGRHRRHHAVDRLAPRAGEPRAAAAHGASRIDFFRRAARRTYREIRERIARINGYLQEAISGMTVIALFAREDASLRRVRAA